MRIVPLLSWAAITAGVAGIVAGKGFDVPTGLHFGVFLIGAGFSLEGLTSTVTRRLGHRLFADSSEVYEGTAAIIWGLMALLIGTAFIAAAYLMQSGDWRLTINQLARHPGPAFLAIGLLVAGAGALLMVHRNAVGMWRKIFIIYPRVLIGLTIVLTGLLAAGVGTWEWVSPRAFDRHLRSPDAVYLRAVCETWKELLRGNRGIRVK